MIVVSKTFSTTQNFDYSSIAALKDIIFVDIETTGLSPSTSSLYLIGAVYHQQMEWNIRQWFADSLSAEKEILTDFFQFLSNYSVIVTYNGDAFDLPFLLHCAEQYGIPVKKDNYTSLDVYKKVRPLKKFLPTNDLKLQTIENFLGITRTDEASGKDMIPVYKKFLETQEESLYEELLSHNESDLKALPQIMPILGYLSIFQCSWHIAGYSLNRENSTLTVVIDCSSSVPVSVSYDTGYCRLSLRGNQMIVEMPVLIGELKYFFENYQEYDYLPMEDRAVHRKVAQYVDKAYRVRATAATCYTRKEGIFVPLDTADDPMFPVFRENYESAILFTEYQDDQDFLLAYLRLLLTGSTDVASGQRN